MLLFARNEAANAWLADHPLVVGAIALALGLTMIALGVSALVTGKAPAKRGRDLEGANAKAMGFVWLGFGGLCVLFGLFKVATGLLFRAADGG